VRRARYLIRLLVTFPVLDLGAEMLWISKTSDSVSEFSVLTKLLVG
jgi:hypothetical protein